LESNFEAAAIVEIPNKALAFPGESMLTYKGTGERVNPNGRCVAADNFKTEQVRPSRLSHSKGPRA
jgi:hypothetical protein